MVRFKLSAGDLASGEAAAEEYKRTTGVDAEYLDAVGWLARGAQMLGRREKAAGYAAEVRKAIPAEDPALLVPLGAAIEVEGRLRLAADGRGAALRYWETELAGAKDSSLRSRIRKNMNLVSLEGEKAPEIGGSGPRLASLAGKPVLLFFWAAGAETARRNRRSSRGSTRNTAPKGLGFVAPTRLYGSGGDDKDAHAGAGVGLDRERSGRRPTPASRPCPGPSTRRRWCATASRRLQPTPSSTGKASSASTRRRV